MSEATVKAEPEAGATPAWKLKANLMAQFALTGHSLSELSDGSFLAHRWNLSKPLPDLQAAARFLRLIGGKV